MRRRLEEHLIKTKPTADTFSLKVFLLRPVRRLRKTHFLANRKHN